MGSYTGRQYFRLDILGPHFRTPSEKESGCRVQYIRRPVIARKGYWPETSQKDAGIFPLHKSATHLRTRIPFQHRVHQTTGKKWLCLDGNASPVWQTWITQISLFTGYWGLTSTYLSGSVRQKENTDLIVLCKVKHGCLPNTARKT